MRLDPDCVRDILIYVEEHSTFHDYVEIENYSTPETLQSYDHNTLLYHVQQCYYSNLIMEPMFADGGDLIRISDLAPKGHEFLANTYSDTIWNDVKSVSRKVGSKSLNVMVQIATAVVTQIIKDNLHSNL